MPPNYFLDSNLCFWVRSQQWLKAEGDLSIERVVAKLEKFGFRWEEDRTSSIKNRVEAKLNRLEEAKISTTESSRTS